MIRAACPSLRAALLACFFSILLGLPANPVYSAAGSGTEEEYRMAVFFLAPLVDIYEGDLINLPYAVEDLAPIGGITLAPLTVGEAWVSAELGNATVTPVGMSGVVTYNALKAGQEVITLTVGNYFGSVTGTTELTIKPKPNYRLRFTVISSGQDVAGGFFRAIFSGYGEFANVPEAPIQGSGSADYWFSLGASNAAFQCRMTPPVQGTSSFQISGMPGLMPLIVPPGFVEPFTLDLQFPPMMLNESVILCQGLGDITAQFPWSAQQADPNDFRLRGLDFPGEGGVIEITGNKTWGYIIAKRIEE